MTPLTTRSLIAAATAAVVGSAAWAARGYRRDATVAQNRLSAVQRHYASTPFGTVEYAESGAGDPIPVSHGIFHGCGGGLLSVRSILHGRRIIAPSRFGYLGSELPAGAAPRDQADAFAALLDHLNLSQVDIIGISAGTTAALEFALHYPDRTKHLIVLSGNFPGDPTAAAPPAWAKLLYRDLPLWLMKKGAPVQFARLMGVPAGFPRTPEQAQEMDEMMESIFPIGPRTAGAVFDAYVSNPAVNDLPIDKITVPTIIVHAKDDPMCAFAPAEDAAQRIPGCVLVAQESGGHLGLGQAAFTRAALDHFLEVPGGPRN
ncbi:alpha/beta fold hydrolase [Pseudarthrobacter sp. alpha12b]